MKIDLRYGRSGLRVTLPDDRVDKVLRSRPIASLSRPQVAVREALARPFGKGTKPLSEAARGAKNVLVVISDITRPVPYPILLPPLLEILEEEALIPRSRILILVATGLHRPNLKDELVEMVGECVLERYPTHNHNARDLESHVEVGLTARGTRVLVDRRYVEADFRITTSLIEPHFMAGFSGGPKAICPGLCAAETIGALHGATLLECEGVEAGRLEGNPVHDEILSAARLAGCDYSINVTIDAERHLAGAFAGELDAAHRAGCKAVEARVADTVDAPRDIVVTTAAGHPLDSTFYQAIKGLVLAAPVVKPGGTIVIAAECKEGLGGSEFSRLVRDFETPQAFLRKIQAAEGFTVDQWQLQMLCKVLRKAEVVLVSEGLEGQDTAPLGLRRADLVEEAVREALIRHGSAARIVVIPEGPYVLAHCR